MKRLGPAMLAVFALAGCGEPQSRLLAPRDTSSPQFARGTPGTGLSVTDLAAQVCRDATTALRVTGSASLNNTGSLETENLVLTGHIEYKDGDTPFQLLGGTEHTLHDSELQPGSSVAVPFAFTFPEHSDDPPYRLVLEATITNHAGKPGEPSGPSSRVDLPAGPHPACGDPVNTPPFVVITAPANDAVFAQGATVTFEATATDTEDGDLSAQISWSSDLAGNLGSGAAVSTSSLAAGTHIITAAVTDSWSVAASAQISITIEAQPTVCTNVVDGYVLLQTQAEVNALQGVCRINGALELYGESSPDPITSLQPLSQLAYIRGGLFIGFTTQLTSLAGLERLTIDQTLSGQRLISINDNAALTSLAALASNATSSVDLVELTIRNNAALADVAGLGNLLTPNASAVTIAIDNNAVLASLAGLEAITTSAGDVTIRQNPELLSLEGLANLAGVGTTPGFQHNLQIEDNGITSLGLTSLQSVSGSILILDNPNLAGSLSFTLNQLGWNFTISSNPLITSVSLTAPGASLNAIALAANSALASLNVNLGGGSITNLNLSSPALTTFVPNGLTVTNSINISSTNLTAITGFGSMTTLTGSFIIQSNPVLTDIDTFSGLQSVGTANTQFQIGLRVMDNPALCVPAWVHDITVTGTTTVTGNSCN